MKTRYTKKQRADAALALAVVASHDVWGLYSALDVTGPAYSLAVSAANVALIQRGNYCWQDYRAACAEAEAMLRTGWSP